MHDPRRAPPNPEDAELQGHAFKWLAQLPSWVRPLQMGRQYPRVVNRLAMVWGEPAVADTYFTELIAPPREGRRGFPSEIVTELDRLYLYFRGQLETPLPDKPWMDPGHEAQQGKRAHR